MHTKLIPDPITSDYLKLLGANAEEIEAFGAEWPGGCPATAQSFRRMTELGMELDWFANEVLPDTSYQPYWEARDTALQAYEEARDAAWQVCKEVTGSESLACEEARDTARLAYEEARATAYQAYREAEATALIRALGLEELP